MAASTSASRTETPGWAAVRGVATLRFSLKSAVRATGRPDANPVGSGVASAEPGVHTGASPRPRCDAEGSETRVPARDSPGRDAPSGGVTVDRGVTRRLD